MINFNLFFERKESHQREIEFFSRVNIWLDENIDLIENYFLRIGVINQTSNNSVYLYLEKCRHNFYYITNNYIRSSWASGRKLNLIFNSLSCEEVTKIFFELKKDRIFRKINYGIVVTEESDLRNRHKDLLRTISALRGSNENFAIIGQPSVIFKSEILASVDFRQIDLTVHGTKNKKEPNNSTCINILGNGDVLYREKNSTTSLKFSQVQCD